MDRGGRSRLWPCFRCSFDAATWTTCASRARAVGALPDRPPSHSPFPSPGTRGPRPTPGGLPGPRTPRGRIS
ncbi:hypothetical protein F8144_12590 [Streptomyces triticiradicis]|uniref:Uncharacterized protein n=1 Tax=Streptomyces triticiradicis TaxID=2651189 RepID=A0A7J5DII1_9ACTN|nr:hypothetical protein F8144_12590 [Streptomyces triticiradicis]